MTKNTSTPKTPNTISTEIMSEFPENKSRKFKL